MATTPPPGLRRRIHPEDSAGRPAAIRPAAAHPAVVASRPAGGRPAGGGAPPGRGGATPGSGGAISAPGGAPAGSVQVLGAQASGGLPVTGLGLLWTFVLGLMFMASGSALRRGGIEPN